MPSREQILELNSEQVDLQRTGISDASATVTITVAGDSLSPAAPSGVSANAVPKGILVEWTNPSLNADGSTCTDQRWANIYYKSTTGVTQDNNDGSYTIAAKQGTNSAYTDTNVGTGTVRYYVVVAMDGNGNKSVDSPEVDSTGGGTGDLTEIPDDATGLVFDDTKGTEGIVVGDGILGIAFKQPASTWSNFDHYRLWYSVDANGGFGAWTEITPTNRIGYLHKGLTKTSSYRYKATIIAADGTESSTEDKAKADDSGYTPNGSNNNLIVAELVFAENIVATNEVRGEHFYAQSYLAINDTTFGNDGIQLEYNSGNPRGYIGNGVTGSSGRFFNFDGTNISWTGANTSLTAAGAFAASSATISGAITATSGTIGSFTIGTYLYTGSKTAYNDANAGVHLGSDGLGIGNNVFTVSSAGALVATSATITGTITSSAVTITGGTLNINSGAFTVSAAGAMSCSSATITGNITCSGTSTWTGNSITTSYTAAKCTDAAADQTSAHTSADTTAVNGLASTTLISAGKIGTNLVEAGAINVTNLAAINADLGSITAGTLNIGSGAFTVSAAGAVVCTNLTVNGGTWNGTDIGYGHIAANAVRTSELYIDDDLTFSPGAAWHQIVNCQGIQGYDTAHAVYFGTGSTSDVIVQARTLLYMFLDHSAYSIEFSVAAAGNTLELFELTDTGGAQGTAAGRIKVEANGTVRYIRLYT